MWSGDQALREVSPICQEGGKVADMGCWEGGRWRWRLQWRRNLREIEKEWEANLATFLQGMALQEDLPDKLMGMEGRIRSELLG